VWNTSRDKIRRFSSEDKRSNSRLKSQKQKLHSWTRKCTKVLDSIRNLFLTCESISKVQRPFRSFQYTNFYSCHPSGVTKGFIKGEALSLLRTNSSRINFEENTSNFKTRLQNRRYPTSIVEKHLLEILRGQRNVASTEKQNRT